MNEIYKWTLTETAQRLQKGEVSAMEVTSAALARIESTEAQVNACITVMDEQAKERAAALDAQGPQKNQPLWGVPVTVKDVFLTKGTRSTAGSKMLENYIPPYDAEVLVKLRKAGAVIVAKTNMDEFAMGSANEYSAFGPARNPWDNKRVPGGSSGGAAASIASYQTPGAFGTDTGGSIRQPAALCGCVGLKASYGRISRYGTIAYASSLDQAGPMARRVMDCAVLLSAVAGYDKRDSTSSNTAVDDYSAINPKPLKGVKFGLPKEYLNIVMHDDIDSMFKNSLSKIKDAGAEIVEVSLPNISFAVPAYFVLANAEGSTNMSRYDGVRFGYRCANPDSLEQLYTLSRSQAFGPEVCRRIVLGTFALSSEYYEKFYRKAAKVRRLIFNEMQNTLSQCDFIINPTTNMAAWVPGYFDDKDEESYDMDVLTIPANLAGLPAISIPLGLTAAGLPAGLQITGAAFTEKNLLSAALALEEIFPPLL